MGPVKSDRLFAEGLTKLYSEIDLLEVVKQLRISRFMTSMILSANQRELVKFQQQYALGLPPRRQNIQVNKLMSSAKTQSTHTLSHVKTTPHHV